MIYLLFSRGTPQAQFGLDTIFDLNQSLFKKEVEHRSCVNITFNFREPYMKCLFVYVDISCGLRRIHHSFLLLLENGINLRTLSIILTPH
jgi:hypothetical protein